MIKGGGEPEFLETPESNTGSSPGPGSEDSQSGGADSE
jgi:hypothetical protein